MGRQGQVLLKLFRQPTQPSTLMNCNYQIPTTLRLELVVRKESSPLIPLHYVGAPAAHVVVPRREMLPIVSGCVVLKPTLGVVRESVA